MTRFSFNLLITHYLLEDRLAFSLVSMSRGFLRSFYYIRITSCTDLPIMHMSSDTHHCTIYKLQAKCKQKLVFRRKDPLVF